MSKRIVHASLVLLGFLLLQPGTYAQNTPDSQDTFFLAKRKGLLGRFGKSISRSVPEIEPAPVANPFFEYKGKIIRDIYISRVGFQYDIYDTTRHRNDFGTRLAKTFHHYSTEKLIRRSLFFDAGKPVYPLLMADNERYLRDQPFIKDARILIEYVEGSTDSVDVVVMTKDVFSIGGRFSFSGAERARIELREENLAGSGTRLALKGYYEKIRNPKTDFGAEIVRRNIGGSFIDLTLGYEGFRQAFTSGLKEEAVFYSRIDKPQVTPYMPTTGSLEFTYYKTRNNYNSDTFYKNRVRYAYYNIDGWFGYSLDSRRRMYNNKEVMIHKLASIRLFRQRFDRIPYLNFDSTDYRVTDFTGGLISINIYRQLFYKTNFIYGFGRSEDVPEGFTASLTTGYLSKKNVLRDDRRRPYGGFNLQVTNMRESGFYSSYTFSAGGFFYRKRIEDIDMLLNADFFTRLNKWSPTWFNRIFFSAGVTAQANPVLNVPLFLNSSYGLPYISNYTLNSDLRVTAKAESVFYNTTKILGFRFAPFVFADASLMKPTKQRLVKSELYSAIGGGIRTRNENLVFGTVELRGFYFPRTHPGMRNFKIEITTDIRFRYRNNFVSRPEFVIAN
jgi:hypothetical protein